MVNSEVSMSSKRYTDEFKIEAVRQVTDRGFKVAEVAERLGVTTHSLYAWLRKFGKPGVVQRAEVDQSAEVRRLKAELRRVTEERDILERVMNFALVTLTYTDEAS
ncbi:transposase [Xanthomonas fragariae]|nr:transposase [Xanthomonas fragariae]AOD18408.1 transposase [Xanthomonas fragariae]